MVISRKQAAALQEALNRRSVRPVIVVLAMRYGNPSIRAGLEQLWKAGARKVLVLPLYPQYSAPATASVFDAVVEVLRGWRWLPELRMVMDYHDDEGYIAALAQSLRAAWQGRDPPERLLFSFHGMPRECMEAGDPYYHQCQQTARRVAERLELSEPRWRVAFQSRFGPKEWLRPYADETLHEWGKSGIKRVDVICPGFAADCLETLEEIDIRLREAFLSAGGREFHYIPALNDGQNHIETLADLVLNHIAGWLGQGPTYKNLCFDDL